MPSFTVTHPRMRVAFFRSGADNEPALDFVKSLPKEDRSKIGFDLKTVQIGFPIGMPLCRNLGEGLHEIRTSLSSKREARLLFFVLDDTLIVVSGFIKKTQKTPDSEIRLARDRKKLWLANIS